MADARPGLREMRTLTEAFEWGRTAVGPRDAWLPALHAAVEMLLESNHPMFIWWGPDRVYASAEPYAGIQHDKRTQTQLVS